MAKKAEDGVLGLVLETARVQVAAMNAGIAFWKGWLENAGKFVQDTNKELLAIQEGGLKAEDIAARLTDTSREFLRKSTELPRLAVNHFEAEVSGNKKAARGNRRRAVKIKP